MYRTQYGQIYLYLGLVDLTLHVLKVVAAGCLLIEEKNTTATTLGIMMYFSKTSYMYAAMFSDV